MLVPIDFPEFLVWEWAVGDVSAEASFLIDFIVAKHIDKRYNGLIYIFYKGCSSFLLVVGLSLGNWLGL